MEFTDLKRAVQILNGFSFMFNLINPRYPRVYQRNPYLSAESAIKIREIRDTFVPPIQEGVPYATIIGEN